MKVFAITSDHIGATLDTGHMVSCGYDPVEAFDQLMPRVQVIHLKDVAGPGTDKMFLLEPAKGETGRMVKKLVQEEFRGLVAIEYGGADPQAEVKTASGFVRSIE
ncbi:MAG: TIM barrel protein [Terriglobia bacterium]